MLPSSYHSNEASDELEVLEVIRVDVGGRIDLQTVVVLASVFKQTVHGVQNLMREQEEPFPEKYNTTLEWKRSIQLDDNFNQSQVVCCPTSQVIQEDAVAQYCVKNYLATPP